MLDVVQCLLCVTYRLTTFLDIAVVTLLGTWSSFLQTAYIIFILNVIYCQQSVYVTKTIKSISIMATNHLKKVESTPQMLCI